LGPLGIQETIFIFVIALLIFGPKKLPELGRTIGKAMTEFRRASSELKATFDREMNAIERETELKEVSKTVNNDLYNNGTYDYNYDYNYDSGAYGSESYDYSAQNSSTEGASATQGADTTAEATGGEEVVTASNAPQSGEASGNGVSPSQADGQPVKS
jgi:TatA/E family protein of Tat protein translocase